VPSEEHHRRHRRPRHGAHDEGEDADAHEADGGDGGLEEVRVDADRRGAGTAVEHGDLPPRGPPERVDRHDVEKLQHGAVLCCVLRAASVQTQ